MGRFIKRQNKKDLNVDTKHTLLRQYISNLFPFALNMNGLLLQSIDNLQVFEILWNFTHAYTLSEVFYDSNFLKPKLRTHG